MRVQLRRRDALRDFVLLASFITSAVGLVACQAGTSGGTSSTQPANPAIAAAKSADAQAATKEQVAAIGPSVLGRYFYNGDWNAWGVQFDITAVNPDGTLIIQKAQNHTDTGWSSTALRGFLAADGSLHIPNWAGLVLVRESSGNWVGDWHPTSGYHFSRSFAFTPGK